MITTERTLLKFMEVVSISCGSPGIVVRSISPGVGAGPGFTN